MEFKDGSVVISTETIEEFKISDTTRMLSHEEKIQKIQTDDYSPNKENKEI